MRLLPIAGLALGLLGAASAHAEELRIFGHEVWILGDARGGERLLVDEREVHADWYLSIDEILVLADVGIVIGFSSPGGNACNGAPFILSFALVGDAPPRIDGPLPTCSVVTQTILADQILFETSPFPTRPGQAWVWTPADGIQALPDIPFVANAARGWTEMRERTAGHPADLFDYEVIAQQIYDLLGDRREEALRIVLGVGSGRFDGDMFVGTACEPHNCGLTASILIADMQTRQVFVAYKPDDGPLVILPDADLWPPNPRSALLQWQFGLRP